MSMPSFQRVRSGLGSALVLIVSAAILRAIRVAMEQPRTPIAMERPRTPVEISVIPVRHRAPRNEFLSHMSHELRSPLAAIHQFSTILMDGLSGPITADQHQHLEIILKNVLLLRSTIDDLEMGPAGGNLTPSS